MIFKSFNFIGEFLHHCQVIVGDEVKDGVKDVILALCQLLRGGFGTPPYRRIGCGATVSHGNDITPPDEDLGLTECNMSFGKKSGSQGNKGGFPIGFDLGPLMCVQRVLDCEFVQAKLHLKQTQVALIGRFKTNPDEVVGACRPLAAFINPDIGYLRPLL